MSNSRYRKNSVQNSRQIQKAQPESAEILPALPASDEIDLSGLSFRQQAALPVIAAAPSLSRAARAAGIDEKTLRRWLRDPRFADRLADLRQQSAIIAREELSSLARRGMAVFAEAMADPDPAIRVRAARYALSYAVQLTEMQNLAASLDEMRQLLTHANLDHNAPK